MIITNYNFNNYPGKQLRFVFDDYPIKLVNPYKFRELLTNEEGQYLDKGKYHKKGWNGEMLACCLLKY